MNQLARPNNHQGAIPPETPAGDLNDLFSGASSCTQAAPSKRYSKVNFRDKSKLAESFILRLQDFKEAVRTLGISEITTPANSILGALKQVAEGEIQRIHISFIETILTLKVAVDSKIEVYNSLRCYDDVLEKRAALQIIAQGFDVLEQITIELINYDSQQRGS